MRLSKIFSAKWFIGLSLVIVILAAALRLWSLASLPPSLYWEEVALGYDAYSLVKTGKDHHGNSWPLTSFHSFGDDKPSGYFYALIPFIASFGLNETSVRLPSALAGVMTVIGVGFLSRWLMELLWPKKELKFFRASQLLGMLIAAISPWLIQFSRGGWEVNFASSLLLWSIISGLSATQSKPNSFPKLLVSVLLAGLSMYTYHATRVIAPAIIVGISTLWLWQHFSDSTKKITILRPLLFPLIIFGVISLPLLTSSGSNQRFAETSLFSDGKYVTESNQIRELAKNSTLSRIFGHRYLIILHQVLTNFSTHFSPQFLFISGDQNLRHSTGFTGLFYFTDSVWLIVGTIFILSASLKSKKVLAAALFLAWWLVIGIAPAAITKAAPHALRILPTAPIFLAVISVGVVAIFIWLREQRLKLLFPLFVLLLVIISFGQWLMYWRYYTRIYPSLTASEWQYGYKQMISEVQNFKTNNPSTPIFITREYGRPAMYYWFFTQTDPVQVQAEETTAQKDQAEFLSFQNISFVNSINEAKPGLVVSSAEQFNQLSQLFSSVEKVGEIDDLRGQPVWILTEVSDLPAPR